MMAAAPRRAPEVPMRRPRTSCPYERLWAASVGRIRSGDVELDPVLADGRPDPRRGLTVVARPSPEVRSRVAGFVDRLRELEPDQHYYGPLELHVTVLSLFTATAAHEPLLGRTAEYVSAVDAALRLAPRLRIEFAGVTASAGAILLQGFPGDDTLERLRDALRGGLRDRGLAEGVDERYRLETAHMTIARFRAPLRDGERLAAALQRARRRPFGTIDAGGLTLVKNDWYMSGAATETVKRYRLGRGAAHRRSRGLLPAPS
jgi:2'-5' RNA ligase